jgi:hypothetical protein
VVGTPLVGLTFGLTGHGRAGFAAIAIVWALASIPVRRRSSPRYGGDLGPAYVQGRLSFNSDELETVPEPPGFGVHALLYGELALHVQPVTWSFSGRRDRSGPRMGGSALSL